MAFTLPDSEFGTRIARRLHEDRIAWLTMVDGAGTPQPAPVWFLWEEDTATALVYSQPTAKRLTRIRQRPRTALHLNDDGAGHDLAVLTGTTEDAPDAPPADRNPAYLDKYRDWCVETFGSPERFAELFSVPVRFRAESVRGH